MEAVDDGHRFSLAYSRKHWDMHMHNGDTFSLHVVRERYIRHGTKNMGSPECTEMLELYKDRVYDANTAGVAKTRNFKKVRPAREAAAPCITFTKDVAKDVGKSKAKAEGKIGKLRDGKIRDKIRC
eukprot:jgi/Tetstr1/462851/TSEL_007800.t1